MDFNKRIEGLLDELKIKNGDLSKKSGIDPSIISRYKNGKRKPYKDSSEITALVNAILILADGKDDILLKILGITNVADSSQALYDYLNTKDLKSKKTGIVKEKKAVLLRFSEKLNLVMDLLNISNIQLAYAIEVDASLISRYRNKLRLLHAHSIVINKISDYCVEEAKRKKLSYDLHCLTNTANKYNEQQLLSNLNEWFNDETESLSDQTIDNFLKLISTYEYDNTTVPITNKRSIQNEYIGAKGLENCVLDFLTIVNNSKPTTTHIYTNDQNILMFGDANYRDEYVNLLKHILNKDNKLVIYHDATNSIEDMMQNIGKMLFVYFSAKCEMRYVKKAINAKFQRSFLLAEKAAVLHSDGVINADPYIEHVLSDDDIKVDRYTKQFEELRKVTYPLMNIYDYKNRYEYIQKYKDLHENPGKIITFLSSPLLGTMSTELLNKILTRYNIEKKLKQIIMDFHKLKRETFFKELKKSQVIEYIYIKKELPSLNATGLFLSFDIKYTADEYRQHINELKDLAKQHKNYIVHFTNKKPLDNIKVLIKDDYGTLVTRNDGNSEITFILQHKIITQAFENYISNLINK